MRQSESASRDWDVIPISTCYTVLTRCFSALPSCHLPPHSTPSQLHHVPPLSSRRSRTATHRYESAQLPFKHASLPAPALALTVLLTSDPRLKTIHCFHRGQTLLSTMDSLQVHINKMQDDLSQRRSLLAALEAKLASCERENDKLGVAFWGDRVRDKRIAIEAIEKDCAVYLKECDSIRAELDSPFLGTSMNHFVEDEGKEEQSRAQQTLEEFAVWRAAEEPERMQFPPLEDVLRPRHGHHGRAWGGHGRRHGHPRFGPYVPCHAHGEWEGRRPQDGIKDFVKSMTDAANNHAHGAALAPIQELKNYLDGFLVNFSNQLADTFDGSPRVKSEPERASAPEAEPVIPGAFVNSSDVQTQTSPATPAEPAKAPKPCSGLGKGGFRHKHISCDGCWTGIRGMRYKCEQCPDYDLCGSCLPLLHTGDLHPPHHTFRAMLHRGLEERIKLSGTVQDNRARHPATCDLCSQSVIGVRWKCLNCPDWDCCDSCSATINETHPGHSFVKLYKGVDYVSNETEDMKASVRHPHIICDGKLSLHFVVCSSRAQDATRRSEAQGTSACTPIAPTTTSVKSVNVRLSPFTRRPTRCSRPRYLSGSTPRLYSTRLMSSPLDELAGPSRRSDRQGPSALPPSLWNVRSLDRPGTSRLCLCPCLRQRSPSPR